MALRATCRRFALLPSPLSSFPSCSTTFLRQQYSLLLRSRQLYHLSTLEKEHKLALSQLVCSVCLTHHSISDFYPAAHHIPPETRLCKGHEGRLYMCHHKSMTWEQIQTGGRHFSCDELHGNPGGVDEDWVIAYYSPQNRSKKPQTPLGGNRRAGAFLGPRRLYRSIYPQASNNESTEDRDLKIQEFHNARKKSAKEDLILRLEYFLMDCAPSVTMTMSIILDRIGPALLGTRWARRAVPLGLCPHINTSLSIKDILLRPSLSKILPGRHEWRNTVYNCPDPDCETSFFFRREKWGLFLVVVRNLGPVRDALDRRWVAQLEESRGIFGPTTYCPPLWVAPFLEQTRAETRAEKSHGLMPHSRKSSGGRENEAYYEIQKLKALEKTEWGGEEAGGEEQRIVERGKVAEKAPRIDVHFPFEERVSK